MMIGILGAIILIMGMIALGTYIAADEMAQGVAVLFLVICFIGFALYAV
jgi:uncharacterized protein with PQ loop repeat